MSPGSSSLVGLPGWLQRGHSREHVGGGRRLVLTAAGGPAVQGVADVFPRLAGHRLVLRLPPAGQVTCPHLECLRYRVKGAVAGIPVAGFNVFDGVQAQARLARKVSLGHAAELAQPLHAGTDCGNLHLGLARICEPSTSSH